MISKAKFREALINMMWGAGLEPELDDDYFVNFTMPGLVRFIEAVDDSQEWLKSHDIPTVFNLCAFDTPSVILDWYEHKRRFVFLNGDGD